MLSDQGSKALMAALASKGIDHIVEVAFAANIETDLELLKMGGSIATYATDIGNPKIPFWPMVFKNIQLFFLGSDDFPADVKTLAARDLNAALEAGGVVSKSPSVFRWQRLRELTNLRNIPFGAEG